MRSSAIFSFRLLSVLIIGVALASCSSDETGIDLSSITDDSSTGFAPLTIEIGTTYQSAATTTYHAFNETGTASCSASAGSPSVTCTADIPESQLFLSTTTFRVTFSSVCSVMSFRPYRYLASISATYTPPGQTSPIDCSLVPEASCYGGAAIDIVPSFPDYNSVFATPTATYTTETYLVDSANSKQLGSNRLIASDLAPANVGNTYASAAMGNVGDGYEPNSFRDYYLSCEDAFGTPLYDITLVITETDGALNDHWSFKEL